MLTHIFKLKTSITNLHFVYETTYLFELLNVFG